MNTTPLVAVIDDNDHVLAAIERLLKMQNYEVHTFTSAEAFLESQQLSCTSCVVSDLRLPGMHGLTLFERLKQRDESLPLIFITAHPEDISRRQPDGIEPVCVLKKPFDADQLIDCINRALNP